MAIESGSGDDRGRGGLPWRWLALALLALAASYLLLVHGAHAAGWLPFLVLLACPLMHLFHGHGGHGGHGGGHGHRAVGDRPPRPGPSPDERRPAA